MYTKRILSSLLIVILSLVVTTLCCSFTLTNEVELRALHPETKLYSEASFDSEIVYSIPQNALLSAVSYDPIENSEGKWYNVHYGDKEGYVAESYLYTSPTKVDYNVVLVKATAEKLGESIKIYSINNIGGTVIGEVNDGTKLRRIISDVDYGDFYEISYEGERAFVKKSDTTQKMTLYQKTALICACSFIGLLILMLTLIYLKNSNVTRKKKVKYSPK